MPKATRRRKLSLFLAPIVSLPLILQPGCGTILHPERQGQTSGRIDPAIVLLDGLGLLLFLIPGIIAFAVDFHTGAIYLPPDEVSGDGEQRVVHLDPDEMTREKIAEVVREETGKEVTLTEADMRVLRKHQPSTAFSELDRWNEAH